MTVNSEAIEFLPFVIMVSWGTTCWRYVAAKRQAQKQVMTAPDVALPSRIILAPYQNPSTNVPSKKKSVKPADTPHTNPCLIKLLLLLLTDCMNLFLPLLEHCVL